MLIRIHDTDYEGNPVDCTGDYFRGETALDIVEGMKMNPYQSHLTPHGLMYETLAIIHQKDFRLPDDPNEAAVVFLQKLTALGYAHFELEDAEIDMRPCIAVRSIDKTK